jgi:hypothetical protein
MVEVVGKKRKQSGVSIEVSYNDAKELIVGLEQKYTSTASTKQISKFNKLQA